MQTIPSADAAAPANQRSTSWIPRAILGSERARKTLSCSSPSSWVEEGIAEQRPAERGEGSFQVDGEDEYARAPRAQPAGRVSEDEVEEERKGEARGERAEAQDERRPALPAGPERREPDNTLQQSQVAYPPGRPGEGRDEAGRHERKTGEDGEDGSEVGATGIGRELARATRDGERAPAVGERDCPGGEPSAFAGRTGTRATARLWHLARRGTLMLATSPLSGQPRCGRASPS